MPEGDTIHRVADRLRPALVGRPLTRLDLPRVPALAHRPAIGTSIAAVDAAGKHLLIRFADGAILRTHLRMSGSWHLYRTGERWRRPPHLARAVVGVEGWEAVCFSAPVVVLEHEATGGAAIGHLGPDLTKGPDAVDIDAALDRMASHAESDTEIGVALLDQRVASGIGNVFKSEVLWACRVDPFAPVRTLDEATRRRLLTTAARMLRANVVHGGHRVTHGTGYAVYGRRGMGCPRCDAPVRMRRQGEQARSTYWCPVCQTSPAAATPSG